MSSRYVVTDRASAEDFMKKFSDVAYNLSLVPVVEKAIQILYGKAFRVITDMAKRMQFQCRICNQEMNSQGAVSDHSRSGKHQKNLDKARLTSPELIMSSSSSSPSSSSRSSSTSNQLSKYSPSSIQYKFLVNGRALGLQFLEEFSNGHRRTYYRCILCGAHGKIDAMYNHMIGQRHAEKYIKTTFVLKSPILTANEREGLRKRIIDEEGIAVESIAVFKDPALYPYKWEAEGVAARYRQGRIKEEIKNEPCSEEPSDNEPEEPKKKDVKCVAVQTLRSGPEKLTWADMDELCRLFYLMIAIDGPESKIKSTEDLEFVVELQINVCEFLYKLNRMQKDNKPVEMYENQKMHLEKILGTAIHVIKPALERAKQSAHTSSP